MNGTQSRRWLIQTVLSLVVAAGLIGPIAPSVARAASSERAAITVSPSDDLVSGQEVDVQGSGFPAGHNIRVLECKTLAGRGEEPPKGKPQGGCVGLGNTTADTNGRFSIVVTVMDSFVWEQYPWDAETLVCEDDCVIEANNYFYEDNAPPRKSRSASHPITFAD
jgi:hypothetical protein